MSMWADEGGPLERLILLKGTRELLRSTEVSDLVPCEYFGYVQSCIFFEFRGFQCLNNF
jgi:hypothetical protein